MTAPATAAPADVTPRRWRFTVPVTLLAGLAIAAVSGSFSVVGLTAIFTGAFWPIIGMGAALEFGKIAAVTWLGRRYAAPATLKAAVTALTVTLMGLNAIGSYGYLAHAHLEHAVAGEVAIEAKAADVAARRQVIAGELADADRRIAQIDGAVAEATRRGRTKAAMALIADETPRRNSLVAERTSEATALASLQVESAAVAGENSQLAADSGPVHYLAVLVHYLAVLVGANDQTLMRWFIAIVSFLLDPFAVTLLLASAAA